MLFYYPKLETLLSQSDTQAKSIISPLEIQNHPIPETIKSNYKHTPLNYYPCTSVHGRLQHLSTSPPSLIPLKPSHPIPHPPPFISIHGRLQHRRGRRLYHGQWGSKTTHCHRASPGKTSRRVVVGRGDKCVGCCQ